MSKKGSKHDGGGSSDDEGRSSRDFVENLFEARRLCRKEFVSDLTHNISKFFLVVDLVDSFIEITDRDVG
jgi:hypothetical protein